MQKEINNTRKTIVKIILKIRQMSIINIGAKITIIIVLLYLFGDKIKQIGELTGEIKVILQIVGYFWLYWVIKSEILDNVVFEEEINEFIKENEQ